MLKLSYVLIILIISPTVKGENLKDVLEDAYRFYPDIKKSQIEFENAKKGKDILDRSGLKIISATDLNSAAEKIVNEIK